MWSSMVPGRCDHLERDRLDGAYCICSVMSANLTIWAVQIAMFCVTFNSCGCGLCACSCRADITTPAPRGCAVDDAAECSGSLETSGAVAGPAGGSPAWAQRAGVSVTGGVSGRHALWPCACSPAAAKRVADPLAKGPTAVTRPPRPTPPLAGPMAGKRRRGRRMGRRAGRRAERHAC